MSYVMCHVMCHVSRVTCHMSRVTCHMSPFFFFLTKWWSLLVEGLLSTGPTPSSFLQGSPWFGVKVLRKLSNTKNALLRFKKNNRSSILQPPQPPLSLLPLTNKWSGVICHTSESQNMCETCRRESYLCLYSSVGVRVEVVIAIWLQSGLSHYPWDLPSGTYLYQPVVADSVLL